jgi:acyl-CoA synthetase (NDP forming)
MSMADDTTALLQQIHGLFHPRSVAVVGVPRGMKTGRLFLMALRDQGFPGPIFPVHPEARQIDGLPAYPRVSAIPDPVDLAIVMVPASDALGVIRDCAEKGVKGAVLYTSGFGEMGTEQGRALEAALLDAARVSGMRLVGPNCMGFYVPESGLSFFPELSREPGPVGVITQSGSLGNILGRMAPLRGLRFSKVVSLGNQCDLATEDFLLYLGQDSRTGIIGAYVEGIKDGPRFLHALRAAAAEKPVVLWKVGLTPEGERAARSHTGSMAGSREIWQAVARQGGGVPVVGFEAWVDAMVGFALLPHGLGGRLAIVSGPGGLAVSAAEACGARGLRLAELSLHTRARLREIVPPTGTSVANPVDVGLSASLDMAIYEQAARAAAEDPGVDGVMVIGRGFSAQANRDFARSIIGMRKETGKPFVMVNIPGFDPDFGRPFAEAGVPVFDTAERASRVYATVLRDQRRRRKTTRPPRP